MKGVKKCYGLLPALFIIFGLLLSVCSEDTSALKYSINSFPLYQTRYSDLVSSSGETIGFWFDNRYNDDLSFNSNLFDLDYSYKYRRSLDNSVCVNSSSKSNIFASNASNSYVNIWSGEGTSFYRSFGVNNECDYNITIYSYDMFLGSLYNVADGDIENVVNIDRELFGNSTSSKTRHLSRVTLPIVFDDTYSFPANTPMTISVGLVTDFDGSGFSDYSTPDINYTARYSDNSGVVHDYTFSSSECSINNNYEFLTVGDNLSVSGHYAGFLVSCSFTPSTEVNHFVSTMIIYSGSIYNPSSFLSYTSSRGLFFSASYLVTDNDDTWSGINISRSISGELVSYAPGYVSLYGRNDSSCTDWFCSLSNLFSFSFLNPFAGLFTLFQDNSQCVDIPILAGMLHSEETSYCPWFDSSVRNVLTPVLGIASVMLIFGFAVRWLGARSGNFIEDSGGLDSGGYHFENKFRSRK